MPKEKEIVKAENIRFKVVSKVGVVLLKNNKSTWLEYNTIWDTKDGFDVNEVRLFANNGITVKIRKDGQIRKEEVVEGSIKIL